MLEVTGIYKNGYVKFNKKVHSEKPLKVIVTFLDNIEPFDEHVLQLSDFSFYKSRKLLKEIKGAFSDEVIRERRNAI